MYNYPHTYLELEASPKQRAIWAEANEQERIESLPDYDPPAKLWFYEKLRP